MQTKRKQNSRFKEFIDNLKPMRVNGRMIKPVYLILLFNIFGFFLALGSNEKGIDIGQIEFMFVNGDKDAN